MKFKKAITICKLSNYYEFVKKFTDTVSKIKVGNGIFKSNYNNKKPISNEFDADHMDIKHINFLVENTKIEKDTIKGSISYLNAKERCGLVLKQFKSNVIVSPNKTICNQLYIATNNSEIRDYYAMYYNRFPDFLNYMEAVTMIAKFKNAKIDLKDVAYFSRTIDVIPYKILINTNFKGTVDKFKATATEIKAPFAQFKGEINIEGLPNWESSILNVEHANINIDKKGLEYYAPGLTKNSPTTFTELGNLNIVGSFNGTINHFATKNNIKTAIGNAQVDLTVDIPKEKNKLTAYNGKVTGQGIALGKLIGNKEIGNVDANLKINGKGFNINEADINLDGNLDHLEIKKYAYKQILIKGTLDKKVFKGNLIVDDENLALSFNGSFDFSNEKKKINALANLLYADFQKIGLSIEPFNGNADFDLNLSGSNINNLEGTAQLNNIDLKRGKEKLNIDFIALKSTILSTSNHEINIESNDFKVGINGLFKIENIIDASKQYLYKYLPSYVSKSKYNGDAQNFSFNIATKKIDKLIHIINKDFDGFNNTLIEGTGLKGKSLLYQMDDQLKPFGKKNKLDPTYFGEGITVFDGKIYQLTWEEHVVFVYDATTFKKIKTLSWPYEGWGLTHNDTALIVSTGSSNLYFVNPNDFSIQKTLGVFNEYGYQSMLNELEYVDGKIFANIYGQNNIVVIDPNSGKITNKIDCSNLLAQAKASYNPLLIDAGYVLNGIAYRKSTDTYFLTGKCWPVIVEVKLN